jgi:hypothetical protein
MNALSALPEQPMPFRERGMRALETHQGADLISLLALHHDHAIAEVTEQAVSARNSAVQTALAASIDQAVYASVMSIIGPMLRTSGENAARAGHFATMTEAVRGLIREAEGAGAAQVDIDALRRITDVPVRPPAFRPLTLGFTPSTQYRIGHFRHVSSGVEWHLPFSGFSLCEEAPDRPMTVHVAFLHKGVVRPRPQLYAEFGMVMEHME